MIAEAARAVRVALVGLALVAALLVLVVGARVGPGVTPDSVTYLSTAEGVREHAAFRQYDGQPYVEFPPLYPLLLAAGRLIGVSGVHAAQALNALAFGAVVLLAGAALWRLTGSVGWSVAGAAATLASAPVLTTVLHVWTEPLFTVWVMLALAALQRYVERPQMRWAVAAGAMAALAALTRYAGMTVALAALLLIALQRGVPMRERLRHASVMLAVAVLPLLPWLLRNVLEASTLAGERYAAGLTLTDNVRDVLTAGAGWFLPDSLALRVRVPLLAVLAGLLLLGALPVMRTGKAGPALPYLLFPVLYVGFLVVTSSIVGLDRLGSRLLAPMVPPLTVRLLALAALATSTQRAKGSDRTRAWVPAAVAGVLLLLAAGRAAGTLRNVLADGIDGYAAAAWRDSALVAHARQAPAAALIYSNDPFALWYLAGRSARLSPRRHPYASPDARVDDLTPLREELARRGAVDLYWFDGVPRDFLLTPGELANEFTLEPVSKLSDGTVYRLTARSP